MKREMTGKNIYQSISRRKFLIEYIKRRENFIKPVIYIYNKTFDV